MEDKIRKIAIVAICSDDYLLDRLVLKGGNALSLVHGIGLRTSLDIDFSIERDFEDVAEAERRLLESLKHHFALNGLTIFDALFRVKPKGAENDWWGGYCVEFKLIQKGKADAIGNELARMRRESQSIDNSGQGARIFTIDISKNEFTGGKAQAELDGYVCYVYTPHMIAAEKLRAICQQMEGYQFVKNKKRRARDFYDIHAICEAIQVDFTSPDFHYVVEQIFQAKQVPLDFLGRIATEEIRAFHATDWVSARNSVIGAKQDFDYYFNYVCAMLDGLKPLWVK